MIDENDFDIYIVEENEPEYCDFCNKEVRSPDKIYYLKHAGMDVCACSKCAELGEKLLNYMDLGYWDSVENKMLHGEATEKDMKILCQRYPNKTDVMRKHNERLSKEVA